MKKICRFTGICKVLLLFLLTAGIHTTLSAQGLIEDGEPKLVIEQPFDVRTLSMGSATFSDRMNFSPMGVNASLLGLREPDMVVQFNSAHRWSDNRMVSSVTLPTLASGFHRITGRFGLNHQGSNHFNYLKSATEPAPDMQIYLADIAYAYRFSSAFSMGLLNRFSHIRNEDDDLISYSADLGLVYAPQGKITYALIARGIGRHATLDQDTTGDVVLRNSSEEASIELGATINYPIQSEPILSISFSNEKRLYEDGIWYKGGVEVLPIPMIALRSGIQFHLGQSVAIPRYGMGVNLGFFHLDYMVSPHARAGEQFHQMGVTIEL